MRLRLILLLFLLFPLLLNSGVNQVLAQQDLEDDIRIHTPIEGEAIQGNVPVRVSASVAGFESAELTFSYAHNPTDTWFLIAESDRPLFEATMVEWDTSLLSDGNYTLRLVVKLKDGDTLTQSVEGIRIRNYSPIETSTPTPRATPAAEDTSAPTPTRTLTPAPVRPTATDLPPNPLQLSASDFRWYFARGGIGIGAVFLLMGLYNTIRRLFKK